LQLKRSLVEIEKNRGFIKDRHTTDKELHQIREKVAREMFKEAQQNLLVLQKNRRHST
jgi:hypothetical protein